MSVVRWVCHPWPVSLIQHMWQLSLYILFFDGIPSSEDDDSEDENPPPPPQDIPSAPQLQI